MGKEYVGHLIGTGLRFVIVISRFNETIGRALLQGAQDALVRHGVAIEDIDVVWVPRAFELQLAAQRVARTGRYHGVVCLGVVVRGATPHFEYVASQAVGGIAQVALAEEVPVTLGVLTVENLEQAWERAGTKLGNKGAEAALAALEMARLFQALEQE